MEFERQKQFQRNEKLENLLQEINGLLGSVEDRILQNYRMPKYPVVLIVGCGRSGSTLIMQWLAKTGKFAYPTNLLSRFFGAPYIGALIQQLLTAPEYDFNNEIFDFNTGISFSSNLGKTRGALAPNEFWYFWRRFFPYGAIQYLDEQSLDKVDAARFVSELAAVEAVFDKPLALKGHIINWNIPFVSGLLDKVLFVYVKRHPLYNAQSLLEARLKYYGDRKAWYSFRPREYDKLKDLDPCEQVAAQVYFTNCAIEEGLAQIDNSRSIKVDYEEFCRTPVELFNHILQKFAQQGYRVNWSYTGLKNFQCTNRIKINERDCKKVITAFKLCSGVDISIDEERTD